MVKSLLYAIAFNLRKCDPEGEIGNAIADGFSDRILNLKLTSYSPLTKGGWGGKIRNSSLTLIPKSLE
jgi:hypothetical protein